MRATGMVLACIIMLGAAGQARAQDRIIAVVNSEVITQKDLDSFTTFTRMQLSQKLEGQALEDKLASIKTDLLQRLIEDRLILQEAKKSGVKIDETRVKAKMGDVKKRYETEKDFAAELMQQGLSEADVESRIRDQMMMYALIDRQVREKIQVTPGEITEYYNQHKQEMGIPEQRALASVSAETEQAAKDLAEELKKGKDIGALAAEKNIKVNNFSTRQGELKKEVDEAVFALKPGEITEPLNVNGAYYVFKLKEVVAPRVPKLSEVQEDISAAVFERKMQEAVAAWIDGLKKTAYIKVME
jgi:parvulin-like peptidyl-prolyl isomerase